RTRGEGLSTIGAVAGLAALVVSVLAFVRAGRARSGRALSVPKLTTARPLGAVAVLIAAAATAGALYASEASRATGGPPPAQPIWWNIQHVHAVPRGLAGAAEAPVKPATIPPIAKGKAVRR